MNDEHKVDEAKVRDIMRVLCRMAIPRGQLQLLRLLVEHPKGLTSDEYRETLNADLHGQMGVFGALGRRINGTRREARANEKVGIRLFASTVWSGQMNTYRPSRELLTAIDRLPVLKERLSLPMDQLTALGALSVPLPPGIPLVPVVGAAPLEAESPAVTTTPFIGLLDSMAAEGLVYPSDLVANLVLALQVKRFVILTGISGTGKTQIATKLASRLAPYRRVDVPADPGEGALVLTTRPYMRKYRRIMLPQALVARLQRPPKDGPSTLRTKWPDGEADLSVYTDGTTALLFRGESRAWFENLAVGDPFVVRVEPEEGAHPDRIVLDLPPKATIREERVDNAVVVAVRPDWTDHRGLLGSYNPLTRQYLVTPFLRLLLRAAEEAAQAAAARRAPDPFFLILDEMNLARVEHYFADFLSAMESGEALHLHDSVEVEEGSGVDAEDEVTPVPRRLAIPKNLFFIGTVNVDESTYMFSPKVLDRAFTIELNSTDLDWLTKEAPRGGELDLTQWNGRLDPPTPPSKADWQWLATLEGGGLVAEVKAFHRALEQHGKHFGYRVATELARFVRLAVDQSDEPSGAAQAALDVAILEKVLVKLHGTRQELGGILDALLRLALVGSGDANFDPAAWTYRPEDETVVPKDDLSDTDAMFPRSAAKLWRMRDRLREAGFTSWIE